MPAPPHPGRGGGPGKGPPLHRCCHPCTAGTALGVEVGVQGPDPAGTPGTEKTATPGLCSLARTGEGGLGPGPVPRAPVCPGAWKQAGPARREAASGRGRGYGMEDWGLGVVSRAINGSRKPSRLPLSCVCVCLRTRAVCAGDGVASTCGRRSSLWPFSPFRAAPLSAPPGDARGLPAGPCATWPGNALDACAAKP